MEFGLISTGIVVEYNPFHNGHLHHIKEARRKTNADVIIAVMSGNFLQRGEPAIVSKWARAQMALEAGVDLVIELPYTFAVQQAEMFANGAIALLNALGCENFCFGSESGDVQSLVKIANMLQNTTTNQRFQTAIRTHIKQGMSYPSSLSAGFKQLGIIEDDIDLSLPNNILGFHYILAAQHQQTNIRPITISRKAANYHDQTFTSETIASATAIRRAIFSSDNISDIKKVVPATSFHALINYKQTYGSFHHWNHYWPFLQYKLLTTSANDLSELYEVVEGIEYRLKKYALQAQCFSEFMNLVKTKRYTWTRIQRMCVHILTNTKKVEMKEHQKRPEYIRLLAMNEQGKQYLRSIKKQLSIPLISKFSAKFESVMELDSRSTQVFAQILDAKARSLLLHREYSEPPIIQT